MTGVVPGEPAGGGEGIYTTHPLSPASVSASLGQASLARNDGETFPRTRATPERQRAFGNLSVSLVADGGRTRVADLSESGPLRVRMPRGAGPELEALILNNAGGVACGDKLLTSVQAGPGTHSTFSTPGAERIYRSDGLSAEISVAIDLAAGSSLDWLPQETILFDRARLDRRFEVDLAPDARFLALEALVFGRAARGETMREGFLRDVWRVRRDGRLIFADALHLSGPVAALLARPAIGGDARAIATLLYVAPNAESRLDEARALLAASGCEAASSAWRGFLAVRFTAPQIGLLRASAARFLREFRGKPLPRVWML